VLRKIFSPKWEEAPECWKKFANEDLTDLYLSFITRCYRDGPIKVGKFGGPFRYYYKPIYFFI
jgi:hypothetical protein